MLREPTGVEEDWFWWLIVFQVGVHAMAQELTKGSTRCDTLRAMEFERLVVQLEHDVTIRNRGRANGRITVWPDNQTIGVASMRAAGLNARALEIVASVWAGFSEQPVAIPIDFIRTEVRSLFKDVKAINKLPIGPEIGVRLGFKHGRGGG